MNNFNKQPTSDEVNEILKKPLPSEKDALLKLYEEVRQNMNSGLAETQSYKQRQDFLRSVEFRLHWFSVVDMYKMNKRMFWVAIIADIIAIVSIITSFFIK